MDPAAPWLGPNLAGRTVWYDWTAPKQGSYLIRIVADGAAQNLQLRVLRSVGPDVEPVPLRLDQDPTGSESRAQWHANIGEHYRIAVVEVSTTVGPFAIEVIPRLALGRASSFVFNAQAGAAYQIQVVPFGTGIVHLMLDSRQVSMSSEGDRMVLRFESTLESLWRVDVSTDLENWRAVGRGNSLGGSFQFNAPFSDGIPRLFHRFVLDP